VLGRVGIEVQALVVDVALVGVAVEGVAGKQVPAAAELAAERGQGLHSGLSENDFHLRVAGETCGYRPAACEPALEQGCGASDSAGLESGT
jgi:hypothetical protein